MDDLVAWLREQIAETERVARAAGPDGETHWHYGRHSECVTVDGHNVAVACGPWGNDVDEDYARHMVLNDPRAVLAQCEAHTMLLDSITARLGDADRLEQMGAQPADVSVIRAPAEWQLAVTSLAYQHGPGYREEWRP